MNDFVYYLVGAETKINPNIIVTVISTNNNLSLKIVDICEWGNIMDNGEVIDDGIFTNEDRKLYY
jgi:hypothetical protein